MSHLESNQHEVPIAKSAEHAEPRRTRDSGDARRADTRRRGHTTVIDVEELSEAELYRIKKVCATIAGARESG